MSRSPAHKIYGPKGVGALYVPPHATPAFAVSRADQRWRPRGAACARGTLNVPGIVGLRQGLRAICGEGDRAGRSRHASPDLRELHARQALRKSPRLDVEVNGNMERSVASAGQPQHVASSYVEGEVPLDGHQRHRGELPARACTSSATLEPSFVLQAPSAWMATMSPTAPSASASAASTRTKRSTTSRRS